jgi:isopenicillin N synthase-like dioxygenase
LKQHTISRHRKPDVPQPTPYLHVKSQVDETVSKLTNPTQVRTPEGEWRYVKPYPGSITVNLADSLEFLTNGFLKSSIHRVVAPPPDQADIDRLGVLYFVRPEDSVVLNPVQSPVLEKLGYTQTKDESAVGITAGEWVKARVAKGVAKGRVRSELNEETIVGGRSAKYYD